MVLSKNIPIVRPVDILCIIILHIVRVKVITTLPYRFTRNCYIFSKLLQVLDKLTVGFRLPPPPGCPYEIYKLMIECWYVLSELEYEKLDISSVSDSLWRPFPDH